MTEYRNVTIQWKDEPQENPIHTMVAISPNWPEEGDDERVFFYFLNEEEYEEAKFPFNEHEFWIVEGE